MNRRTVFALRCATALLIAAAATGCSKDDDDPDNGGLSTASGQPTAEESSGSPAAAPVPSGPETPDSDATAPSPSAASAGFDINTVPLSEIQLGMFPYFTIPTGYENPNRPIPVVERDRIPFWTGDQLEWVEGRVHQSTIHVEKGRGFSKFELQEGVEEAVLAAGGVRVTDSEIPDDVRRNLDKDFTVPYNAGLGDIYNQSVRTYVVRQSDKVVWVHLCSGPRSAGWIIAESKVEG